MGGIEIFYADDDDDDLMIFNDAVQKISETDQEAINLHLHKNGQNLLENMRGIKSKSVVVFLDLNMPGKSGFQLLKEIRNEPGINHMPVIIYSTSFDTNAIKTSYDLGADFYAIKPNLFFELKLMIKNVMQINWTDHKTDLKDFVLNKPVNLK